jgi:hypothetical protein
LTSLPSLTWGQHAGTLLCSIVSSLNNKMPKYFGLFCARSDGVKVVNLANGKFEENGPTPEQLSKEVKKDKAGSCYDYYRELQSTDAKHVDWRLKLGAMFARERGDTNMKSKLFLKMKLARTDGE